MRPSVSLQLWSVRDDTRRDFAGTLRALADIGYAAVELAGYGGTDFKGALEAVKASGLRVSGMHVGLDRLRASPEQVAVEAHAFGTRDVTCPWASPVLMQTPDGCRRLGEELGRLGAVLRGYGLRLSYHNHAHEMVRVGDRLALDWILDAAAPQDLACQADVYWLHTGGVDAAAYLRQLGRRVPLVHLKDAAELGAGPVDFPAIFGALDSVGAAEWLIVEQEKYSHPPLECMRQNLDQLRRWGKV